MDLQNVYIQFEAKFLPQFERKIAECSSLYSDPKYGAGQISRRVDGAKQALLLIFITTFRPYWETDKLCRAIGQKAWAANYQGNWKQVQSFLEDYESNPKWFIAKYLSLHSTEEFFGNFLPRALKEMNLIQIKPDFPSACTLPKVRRSKQRRGYNDKGTLRLPHENHGEKPSSQVKEDRRPYINHPLLKDLARRIDWDEHSSLKGGNLDE